MGFPNMPDRASNALPGLSIAGSPQACIDNASLVNQRMRALQEG